MTVAKRLLESTALLPSARAFRRGCRVAGKRFRWACGRGFGRTDRRLIDQYLASSTPRMLHLGAGNHQLSGWLNSDLYPASASSVHLDVTQPFPLPDESFQYVFSEHMIEHIRYRDGEMMLWQCHRVLEPGGVIRLSTPNLQVLMDLYADHSTPLKESYLDWHLDWVTRDDPGNAPERAPVFVVNNFMRDWGHQFVYDVDTLTNLLKRCGFVDIVECRLNESEHQPLRGLENEERAPEGLIALETMTLEATKRDLTN